MKEGLNKQIGMGNLAANPELRFTQGGQAVLNARVAATTMWKDNDGKMQERTEWFGLIVWGKRGEALAKILKKGDPIYFEGETRTRSYDKNGEKRYVTEVHAKEIILLGSAPKSEESPRPSSAPAKSTTRAEFFDDFRKPSGASGADDIPF